MILTNTNIRILLLLFATTAAFQAFSAPGGPSEKSAISVPAATAVMEDEIDEYRYTGRVIAISTVNITSRISADLK